MHFDYLNAQGQPKFVWPPTFALARAYLDQLERSNGLSSTTISDVRQRLGNAERLTGGQRHDALAKLAAQLDSDARGCVRCAESPHACGVGARFGEQLALSSRPHLPKWAGRRATSPLWLNADRGA